MLKLCKVDACTNGTLGLHLSRAPWDPYPWVSDIQLGSSAQRAGMRTGDTVLELNGCDVLGQKISEIAAHIRTHWNSGATYVTVIIWRNKTDDGVGDRHEDSDDGEGGGMDHSINQQSLQKFATCLQHIAQLLECPVCLEVIKPPGWQCCNGHVLCNNCRSRSIKCPVCRVPLGPRGRCLLSDKLFTLLAESFPCDGVRSNRNSPTERRKCTPEFHNHPKMAVATTVQPKIKAKEIKGKVKSMRHQYEKPNVYQEKNEQDDEEKKEEFQLDKADKENVGIQTSAGSGNLQACRNLRRTSRTSKVHHQHQKLNNRMEIEKSHNDDKDDDDDDDYDKQLSNCTSSSSGDESSETTVSGAGEPGITYSREFTNSNANSYSNNNNKDSNENVLVKLALKSSKKNQEDYSEPRWGHKITGQSHELQDDEVTIVNKGMRTNIVQQQQHQHQHQQQKQQQQYQNYHCPTGKSCCSYVKTSNTTAKVLTKMTTTTTMTMTTTKKTSIGRGLDGKKHNNNNNNNIINACNTNNLSTTTSMRPRAEDDEDDVQTDAALFASSTISNFSTSVGSLSCNKSWLPEMQQGTHIVPVTRRKLRNTNPSEPLTNTTIQHISATNTTTSCLKLRSEWQILTHLTREHRLAVSQFYGTYGQRIQVDFMHNKSMACLNLRVKEHEEEQQQELTDAGVLNYENVNNYKADKFFLACLPLNNNSNVAHAFSSSSSLTTPSPSLLSSSSPLAKFAIFLWHLPAVEGAADVCNFATIIESKRTGIKWFGRSQPLAKSWSQIHAEGHFLMHEMSAQEVDTTDAFDIVIRIK